ncbi:MAG: non-ribosomal peptide synthetase [[Eubacterium] siraeum]
MDKIIKKIPMTKQQESVYFSSVSDMQMIAYNLPMSAEFDEDTDIERLKKALKRFLDRHDAFRTAFIEEDGNVLQVLCEKKDNDIPLEEIPDEKLSQRFTEFVQPFDLTCAPLARFLIIKTDTKTVLFMDFHHIIFDGTSAQIMTSELSVLIENPDAFLPDAGSYFEYAEKQADRDLSEHRKNRLAMLEGFEEPEPMPADFKRPEMRSFEGGRVYVDCPPETASKIKAVCRQFRITDNMLLIAACLITLSRYSYSENIILGTPVMNREADDMNTIGMFVNTAVISEEVKNGNAVASFIESVKSHFISILADQSYPFSDLVRDLGVKSEQSRNPVFDVLFELLGDEKGSRFKNGYNRTETGRALFDLTFRIFKGNNEYELELEYCTKLYSEATAKNIASKFWYIMDQLPYAETISDIKMLLPEEEKFFAKGARYRELPFDSRTIGSMWTDIVKVNGEKTAVEDGDIRLTYAQLDKAAGSLAAKMKNDGAVKGNLVGVYGTRSADAIMCLIAVLKCGCVYLPIDEIYPDKRVSYIFSDCSPKMIFNCTDAKLDQRFTSFDAKIIDSKGIAVSKTCDGYFHDDSVSSEDPFYCIYTSGTTGSPKGVLNPQRTLLNVILNQYERGVKIFVANTAVTTSIGFDVFLQEVFSALLAGGTLYIISDRLKKNSDAFASYIEEKGIRNIFCTPSYFDVLTSEKAIGMTVLGTLNNIFLAGEKFFLNKLCSDYAAAGKVIFHNDYGPTETHVVTSRVMSENSNSIGMPLANVRAYVLNGEQLLGEGMIGELCIGGLPVSLGYYNNSELSNKVFVNDRFSGGTMYRTGDLVRLMPDGNIDFFGRIDDQIKIRGFRIEPEEIAAVMREITGIDDAAVVAQKDSTGQLSLFAYFTSKSAVDIPVIRDTLSKRLPAYMIPSYIMKLEALPLNHNGKLDKRALPQPEVSTLAAIAAPENERESMLCDIFAQVLQMDRFSATESFYDYGGDSLRAMKVVGALKKNDYKIEVRDIMKYPSPRSLASYLASQNGVEVNGFDYQINFGVNLKLENSYVIGLAERYDENICRPVQAEYEGLVLQKYIMSIKSEKYDFIQGHMTCANTVKIKGEVTDEQVRAAAQKLIEEQSVFRTSATSKAVYTEHSAEGWTIPWVDLTKESISYEELVTAFECLNNDIQYVLPPRMLSKLFVVKVGIGSYEIRYFIHHSLFDGMSHKAVAGRVKALLAGERACGLIEPYSEYVRKCRKTAKETSMSRKIRIRKNIMTRTVSQVVNSRKKKEFYVDVMFKASDDYLHRFINNPLEECAAMYYNVNYGEKTFKAPFLVFLNQRDMNNVENCGMYFDVVPIVYDPSSNSIESAEGDPDYRSVEEYFRNTEVFDLMTIITASQLVPLINYLGVFQGNVFNAKIPDSDLGIEIEAFDSNRLKREKRITCYTLKNWIYFNFIISAADEDEIRKQLVAFFDGRG